MSADMDWGHGRWDWASLESVYRGHGGAMEGVSARADGGRTLRTGCLTAGLSCINCMKQLTSVNAMNGTPNCDFPPSVTFLSNVLVCAV